MTFSDLARAYLDKAAKRRRVLDVLMEQEAYSDVVHGRGSWSSSR